MQEVLDWKERAVKKGVQVKVIHGTGKTGTVVAEFGDLVRVEFKSKSGKFYRETIYQGCLERIGGKRK